MKCMKYQINYENAMSNHGNWDRICRVMRRASEGESLVIGFWAVRSRWDRCLARHRRVTLIMCMSGGAGLFQMQSFLI